MAEKVKTVKEFFNKEKCDCNKVATYYYLPSYTGKKEEQKTLSVNKIDKKLSKLKKASEKVFSYRKAKKLLEQSESLSKDIDFSITTIAKNKFVINKVKKLRSLGSSKDEINDVMKCNKTCNVLLAFHVVFYRTLSYSSNNLVV